MKITDIQNVVELLKLAKFGEEGDDEKERKKPELEAKSFALPDHLTNVLPLITVDGSYSFLFSFLGAETWIVLFRIAITEYCIELKKDKIHYCIKTAPQIYDHLNLISFNESVLSSQPSVFTTISEIASRFQDRKAQIFAS
ncbi:unnamed protein product, partial [marine sediment metagenome]